MERGYALDHDWLLSDKTITVHQGLASAIVKYPKPNGGYFRVKVTQKPNPIGFHAVLPGDRRAA